jgi:hypothetical protein
MTKTRVISAIFGACLFVGGYAVAQINPNRHPNLAEALSLSQQAHQKITAAQKANEWDMGGHAAKAKSLLEEVNSELKQAAAAANRNKK